MASRRPARPRRTWRRREPAGGRRHDVFSGAIADVVRAGGCAASGPGIGAVAAGHRLRVDQRLCHDGPWSRDAVGSSSQACTGVALEHCRLGVAARPPAVIPGAERLPVAIAALGAMLALRRQVEGGSWEVRVSLAAWRNGSAVSVACRRWRGHSHPAAGRSRAGRRRAKRHGDGWGYLAPVAQMSRTPAEWALPDAARQVPPRWAGGRIGAGPRGLRTLAAGASRRRRKERP